MTTPQRARTGVAVVFLFNGWCFAGLVSRFPDLRTDLALTNGGLGLLLLAIAAGSIIALPSSGWLIERWSAAAVVRFGAALVAVGLTMVGAGVSVSTAASPGVVALAAVGLFINGVGTGVWDVAMNVEGAAVERRLGRSIMPRFHAGWSLGSILGAGLGVPMAAFGVPVLPHLTVISLLAAALAWRGAAHFLPVEPAPAGPRGRSAWGEPRTLALGVMVLAFALTEGAANDWLALALIDGYDAPHWVGVGGFAVFVTAMTLGRLFGTMLLDRFGRVPVLLSTAGAALAGLLLVVLGGHPVPVALGIVVWGLGASLGFPVGMSAAADDPARSAARVSVVATTGYVAFLAGPPLIGFVGDEVGTLSALLVVAVVLAPSALAVPAARRHVDPADSG